MNIKIPVLTKRIFDLGSYSKPIVNYLLENKIDVCFRHYLNSLNFIWKRDYNNALNEINLGIKRCKENRSMYYLLLSHKLIIQLMLNDKNLIHTYNKLRREYKNIPPLIRKITNQALINSFQIIKNINLPKSRLWSKESELSSSTKLFLFIGKARKEIKENRIQEGINYYLKGLQIASKIPHPSGLITCLNDISWYLMDSKPLKSLYYAEKGVYYLGYYFEDPKIKFYVLDTLFNIEKKVNYLRIFETKELIQNFKNDEFVKSKYKELLRDIKNYDFNFDNNLYKNSVRFRNYLKKYIKNISSASKLTKISRSKLINILNGKVKNIRSETIKKLIIGLKIDIDKNTPKPIFSEFIKIKIDENFKNAVEFLKTISFEEKIKMVLSTYMALYNKESNFKYLIKKETLKRVIELIKNDFDSFLKFISKSYETKRFISYIINPPEFIKARRDLTTKFLDSLNINELNIFIDLYCNLSHKEREILDIFIRNYIRFNKISFKLNEDFNNFDELLNFINIFSNLNLDSLILSYYYFSKWERVKLIRIIKKLQPIYKNFKQELVLS